MSLIELMQTQAVLIALILGVGIGWVMRSKKPKITEGLLIECAEEQNPVKLKNRWYCVAPFTED